MAGSDAAALARQRQDRAVSTRNSLSELTAARRSMLGKAGPPVDYGRVESVHDALEAAKVPPPATILRLYIVWDNPVDNLELQRVLDTMRETGAAMVHKVEQVDA